MTINYLQFLGATEHSTRSNLIKIKTYLHSLKEIQKRWLNHHCLIQVLSTTIQDPSS